MSDLSNLLGDVYGDHSPDAAPVRREPSADQRAPEFDGWVPGESSATGGGDELSALTSALATPAPAPAPVAPVADVPMPTLAQAAAEAPAAPAKAAWTSSPAPAPAPSAAAVVSAPATAGFWMPGDDDIFPMANAAKKSKK